MNDSTLKYSLLVGVIRATGVFSFDQRPDTVTLVAPQKTGRASIGFVLYLGYDIVYC